jgi:protein ImuA
MPDSLARVAALRRCIHRLAPPRPDSAPPLATGCDAIDARLGGGLARGTLHELLAPGRADAAAATGFAAMLAARAAGALVWLRVAAVRGLGPGGALHPPGLGDMGVDPGRLLLVGAPDPPALLRAAADVLRCPEVALAVIELWGAARLLDLTASRRLLLAAEGSGALGVLLRVDAPPAPSAATTRWAVGAAPSTALAANAPGPPALDLHLLRQRGGPAGFSWRVEWDRDRKALREPAPSGAVAALPERRPADGHGAPGRAIVQPLRHAA